MPYPPLVAYATPAPMQPGHKEGFTNPESDTHPPPGVVVSSLPHPAPPEEMSRRAQVYLGGGTFRHLLIGLFCLFAAGQFQAASFIPIINFVPLSAWGGVMVIDALMLGVAALLRHRSLARLGLIVSGAVTALMASGLWLGATFVWWSGGKATPIAAILLTALVVKDLAVCTDPMKTPLEIDATWGVNPGGAP